VAVGAKWAIVVLGWATILVLLVFRQFRGLFGFLGAFSVKASVGRDPLRGVYAWCIAGVRLLTLRGRWGIASPATGSGTGCVAPATRRTDRRGHLLSWGVSLQPASSAAAAQPGSPFQPELT
jgi:hypothetical protein